MTDSIYHVTTVHSRRDIRIFRKECTALARVYCNVHVLVADGLGDETESGVEFIDLGVPSKSRLRRMLLQPWRMYRGLRVRNPAIVHFHDPELLPVGLLLTWAGHLVIYDAHEDVPRQILSKHWIPPSIRGIVSKLFERFEDFVASRLAGVIAATPHISRRFGRVNVNTLDINNYPMAGELAIADHSARRKSQVCYVGGISRIRGVKAIVDALPLVPDIKLVLCGRFMEPGFEEELRSLPGWRQVEYLGQVDRQGVRSVLAESIAGLVTLLPTPNYLDSLPIKMFEYMSANLPVIASNFPLWEEIIGASKSGLCVDPTSPEAIAKAIRELATNPVLVDAFGCAGRNAVTDHYNWEAESEKLTEFYAKLLVKNGVVAPRRIADRGAM